MAKSTKRKRESSLQGATDDSDPRIVDPYCLQLKPCRLADHQQTRSKKTKAGAAPTIVRIKNCEHNPNCLYGLGEHHKGVWQAKKLLQRVLGDDPRELLRGPYPSFHVTAATTRLAPCGLRNLGATCYLNSMLQCLFVIRPFRQAVYDWEPKASNVSDQQILQMRALQRLFAAMQLGKKSVYDPQEFASTLSLNSVMQQDAQEFSKLLLAHLRVIFQHSRVAEHAELVDRLFQSQMSYGTKCLRCHHKSSRPSSYYEISLNIKGHKTVERCIESYLAAELLDGDNQYFCDECNAKQNAERFIEIDAKKLPSVLTLQLMRFVFDAQAGRKKKLMDVIEVGETLNMTEVLRRCGYAEAFDVERDTVYRLCGYLNHRGKSAHVGHYTASVAHSSQSSGSSSAIDWFEFDDNIVKNMHSVLDTEGVQEHHGKVIKSRDAYMLMYTRVDDPVLESSRESPSQMCLDEISVWNADFASEVAVYEERAKGLESRIQDRTEAYKTFFEKDRPFADADERNYYWVDADWLASWVSGEERSLATPNVASGCAANDAETTSVENGTDAEEPKTDGTDSEDQHAKADDPIVVADDEEDAGESTPTTSVLNADSIPFAAPIDISRFCCAHTTTAHGSGIASPPHFAPENVRKLKRISAPLFAYLKQTCGVTYQGAVVQENGDGCIPVFDAKTFRCTACETNFRDRLVQDASQLSDVSAELGLLKAPVLPGELPTYLVSRAWIASYKSYLVQNQKALQKASKLTSKKPSNGNGIKTHFSIDGDTGNAFWQTPLNEDICCPHGNLTLDKKKYRPVPLDTWLHLSQKFPTARVFEDSPDAEICSMCAVDRATNDEDSQKQRAARDDILDRAPLGRLYRRRTQTQSGSFMLNEVFVPLKASQANRKTCMFLVNTSWMRAWRGYIRDLDQPSPQELRCDDLTCDHGRLLLPRSVIQVVKGKSIPHSEMEVEFVYPEEMLNLGELYGMPESKYYYGEYLPTGQIQWKSCSLSALGEALNNGWGVPSDSYDEADSRNASCIACQDASERVYEDAMHNFENRVVHVQLLAEDQPVPTSATLADESGSGRRRSRRIKTGSGTSWPIAANADDSVYILKTKIFEETDLFPIRQRLYFRGDVLQDSRSLKECGIRAGDAVYMRLSEDIVEELAIADEGHEREVGFEDSVFVTRRSAPPPRALSVGSAPVWVCAACTYVNDDGDAACEMCSTVRAIEVD